MAIAKTASSSSSRPVNHTAMRRMQFIAPNDKVIEGGELTLQLYHPRDCDRKNIR
jgi:hypothetical protein